MTPDRRDDPAGRLLTQNRAQLGFPIDSISAVPDLTFYEREVTLRLSHVIAEFVGALPATVTKEITLLVPRAQYYFYLLPALRRGLISRDLFFEWIRLVDRRHELVLAHFTRELARKLADRSPGALPEVRVVDDLGDVAPVIAAGVRNGSSVDAAETADRLSAADPIWRSVLAAADPPDWLELARLSYCVAALRRTVRDANQRTLTVTVLEPPELKFFKSVQELAERIGARRNDEKPRYDAFGLFPLERALLTDDKKYVSIYEGLSANELIDPSGRPFTADLLLDELYGGPAEDETAR